MRQYLILFLIFPMPDVSLSLQVPCIVNLEEGVEYRKITWYKVSVGSGSLMGLVMKDIRTNTTQLYKFANHSYQIGNDLSLLHVPERHQEECEIYRCCVWPPVGHRILQSDYSLPQGCQSNAVEMTEFSSQVQEHTVHRSLLRMGLCSCRPVRLPMLTHVHRRKHLQWACEHQNWTMEQWKKVAWSDESRLLPGAYASLTWGRDGTRIHYRKKASWRRQCDARGSVMLWAMFCWETLGPGIHVDVTLRHTNYLNIVAGQVKPFMATVFPNGSGIFQQDNAPCHTAEIVQEWNITKRSRC
ncbi:hypothetical protein PGIGA_G00243310 [Pangasianodon gigas]|uniref:Uncharacterized protein n=1 Tax=Pangasianodon gigas TaxID=30993 RepID=A0ACC5WPD2_PANGG|nr:hypothetical protein [Pangasianodon gigas]